ncbi:hypothetical protein SAMN05216298_1028 [Glycomyces sambucus]|uniref:Uncharacterized protein n=1 Tax=Glycomyces sambucus TaxID=380244 RepID=A0A1G9DPX0_9ACTN|nr:hypothetical protein [Glycomyces sambucus]SDK65913.1 hypothetical protein SAMN05216298_1028 [Glycomyces sambucus]
MTDRGEESERSEQEDGREGELLPEDVDRRFNELIKDLEDSGVGSSKSFGTDEDPAEPAPAAPPSSTQDEEPGLLELWDAELPDDEEDDYDPPDPPPVPWPSLPAVGGVLLIIAGLALLVNPTIAPLGTNPGRLVGFCGFLIGVWLLISRLRPDKDADDTDDGAVV